MVFGFLASLFGCSEDTSVYGDWQSFHLHRTSSVKTDAYHFGITGMEDGMTVTGFCYEDDTEYRVEDVYLSGNARTALFELKPETLPTQKKRGSGAVMDGAQNTASVTHTDGTERDVVLTNEFIYKPFMEELGLKCQFVFQEKFGAGEPSEEMIQTMYDAIPYESYDRIIAVGGGAILDLCKLLGIKRPDTVHNLYFKRFPVVPEKDVIAIPTTCGTGSEVTPFAVITDQDTGVKYPLADYELLPDMAIVDADMMMNVLMRLFLLRKQLIYLDVRIQNVL